MHGYVVHDKVVSILMDFAEKGDLKKYMEGCVKLSEQEALHIIYQILHGVEYLHARDIIHRDIKQENVLISEGETFKLCDFGWASPPDDLNRNVICGTYEYMAPEIILQQPYDHKVDIWSVGVLAYELVHGHTPFVAGDVPSICEKILEGNLNIDSSLSDSYKRLICACLEYSPVHRPSADCLLGLPFFKPIRNHYYKKIRAQSASPRRDNSPGMTRDSSPIPLRFSHLTEDKLYEAKVFHSDQECEDDMDDEKEYTPSPRRNSNPDIPARDLEAFSKYLPHHIEIDFAGRKDVSLSNLGDFIDFDLHLGGIPTYLKDKGASILGYFWGSKEEQAKDIPVAVNRDRAVTPRLLHSIAESHRDGEGKTFATEFNFSKIEDKDSEVERECMDDTDENIGEIRLMNISMANMENSMHKPRSPRMLPSPPKKPDVNTQDKESHPEELNLQTQDTEPKALDDKPEESEGGFFSGVKSFFGFGGSKDQGKKSN